MVFLCKSKVIDPLLVVVSSSLRGISLVSISTLFATIDDVCCDAKANEAFCSSLLPLEFQVILLDASVFITLARLEVTCGGVVHAWFRTLWCHVEPQRRGKGDVAVFDHLFGVIEKELAAVVLSPKGV